MRTERFGATRIKTEHDSPRSLPATTISTNEGACIVFRRDRCHAVDLTASMRRLAR